MSIRLAAVCARSAILVAAGCITLAGPALAQLTEEVTVEATRVVTTQVGRGAATGAPINGLSLSYRVSYAGLNLATAAGAAALEQRVRSAADAACRELGRMSPLSEPSNAECARASRDKAMVQVRELVAAAAKAAVK